MSWEQRNIDFCNAQTETQMAYIEAEREVASLCAENGRLRELIRKMWLACKSKGIIGGIYTYPDRNMNVDDETDFRDAMRELGVEVDG